jgi:predicted Zn-dependent protease
MAYAAVHALTEIPLRWLQLADDTPSAIAGEVGGPGDDARVEIASGGPIEVQSKHGLKGQKSLEQTVLSISSGCTPSATAMIVLVVDPTSSSSIRFDFRKDLERLRSGRQDDLRDITRKTIEALGGDVVATLKHLQVVTLDVDTLDGADTKLALQLLADNLEDPHQAQTAWSILIADLADVCAQKLRRTRADLVRLLADKKVPLLPSRRTRRWHEDLRISKQLLADDEPVAALALLQHIERELKNGSPDAVILYRLNQHKSAANLQLHKLDSAITFARKALDHDAKGLHAMINLANALALGGHADQARLAAQRLREIHPEAPETWVISAHVAAINGDPPPESPPRVKLTREFRRGLARLNLFQGNGHQGRELTAGLVAEGDRSSETLMLRVESLLTDIEEVESSERRERAETIERLCTEIIDGTERRSDATIRRALTGRSIAYRALGRPSDADTDLARARETSPDDPSVLAQSVQTRVHLGDEPGALALLNSRVVQETPYLLVLRAGLLAHRDPTSARRDLELALTSLPPEADETRSAAAEAALHLKDVALAKRLIAETSESYKAAAHYLLMRARISAFDGDLEEAEQFYRRASDQMPGHRSEFLTELAKTMLRRGDGTGAVRVFGDAKPIPNHGRQALVHALITTDLIADAQRELDELGNAGQLPDWAIEYSAQIAIRRNDPIGAATHLEHLVSTGQCNSAGRLTLTATLIDLGEAGRAQRHLEELLSSEELEPRERMQLAQTLLRVQRSDDSVRVALRAYREAPDSPEIARAFAGIVIHSKTSPVQVDEVGPDTHVELHNDTGQRVEYLIFGTPAHGRLPNEISIDSARAAGLLALRVGQVFSKDIGTWYQKDWKVTRVRSAVAYLVDDIFKNYSTRFPNEPFFIAGFKVDPEKPEVSDLSPMISSVQDRTRRAAEIAKQYTEHGLPLDFVASVMGTTVPEFMGYLASPANDYLLLAEWSDEDGRRASRETARDAQALVVVTRSALVTMQTLGILPMVAGSRRFIGPRSLRDAIRAELTEAEDLVREGYTSLAPAATGFAFRELAPGDQSLVSQRDGLKALLEWCDANVEFRPRPLEAFEATAERFESNRTHLGDTAVDSLELAVHTPASLFADDIGLRRFALVKKARSLSCISLLPALTVEGRITPQQRDGLLVDLVELHYAVVMPSAELLVEALAPSRTPLARQRTFSLLALDSLDPAEAAHLLLRAVIASAVMSIQTAHVASVVRLGLEAMAQRLPRLVCAQMVFRLAEEELSLLPRELQIVRKVCVAFAKTAVLPTQEPKV